MPDPNNKSSLESIFRALATWNPRPIPPPEMDPGLDGMNGLQRAAEILRHRLHIQEFALAPRGTLRAFLRLCMVLGLLIGIPAILVVPAIVVLFYGLADMTAALAAICMNILQAVVAVAGIVAACWVLVAFSRKR